MCRGKNKTGLSNVAIARVPDVEREIITKWEKGKTKTMSVAADQELGKNFSFASDGLVRGKGPMYLPKTAFDNDAVIYGKYPLFHGGQLEGGEKLWIISARLC